MELQEQLLWQHYDRAKDYASRAQLVMHYADWACCEAKQWARQLFVTGTDIKDYEQYALIGLMEALDQFDPSAEVPFRLFARFRVKGAILNSIFSFSEKSAQLSAARLLESDPVHVDNADPIRRIYLQIELLAMRFLLQDSVQEPLHNVRGMFYSSVELTVLKQKMLHEVLQLAEPEQSLMLLHYQLDVSFSEIAEFLQLSRGRISQIHKQILDRLMRKLALPSESSYRHTGNSQYAST
jgi:RNA polymerase sigma factor for flagellar operon FliA